METNPFPPPPKTLIPGETLNTGDYVYYTQETVIGNKTGEIDNYYGINYLGVPFVWQGKTFTIPKAYDARNYHSRLTNPDGIPSISNILEIKYGSYVSSGYYYIISENTKFGLEDPSNYNGINYIGKVYIAETDGEVKGISPSNVLGTSIVFTPSAMHGNTTPFPEI